MIINREIEERVKALESLPHNSIRQKYLLAVSGGPDSSCLLSAFSHVVGPMNCVAVGVDHGLRKESLAELELASAYSKRLGVPFHISHISISSTSNVQAEAREKRYEALRTIALEEGAAMIVTAHHRDDQAETVLLRLLRGQRLFGMETVSFPAFLDGIGLFRPLLNVPKSDIDRYISRWKIPYSTDPSNSDSKYTRNWVRHELLPFMETRSPKIREFLARMNDD